MPSIAAMILGATSCGGSSLPHGEIEEGKQEDDLAFTSESPSLSTTLVPEPDITSTTVVAPADLSSGTVSEEEIDDGLLPGSTPLLESELIGMPCDNGTSLDEMAAEQYVRAWVTLVEIGSRHEAGQLVETGKVACRSVPLRQLPSGQIMNPQIELDGLVTAYDIPAGAVLKSGLFRVPSDESTDQILARSFPAGTSPTMSEIFRAGTTEVQIDILAELVQGAPPGTTFGLSLSDGKLVGDRASVPRTETFGILCAEIPEAVLLNTWELLDADPNWVEVQGVSEAILTGWVDLYLNEDSGWVLGQSHRDLCFQHLNADPNASALSEWVGVGHLADYVAYLDGSE